MKYLILALLLLETVSLAQTEWPIGKDKCGGRWSYERYPEGSHEKHGLKSQTCEHNAKECGTEVVHTYFKCKDPSHGYGPWGEPTRLETKLFSVWWDHHHMDKDVDMHAHCRGLIDRREIGPHMPNPPNPKIGYVNHGLAEYHQLGKKCIRRDRLEKCQAWRYESKYSCFLTIKQRDFVEKETAACGIKSSKEVAKHCCHTPIHFVKRTKYVGEPIQEIWSESRDPIDKIPDTSSDVANGGRVLGSEQCRSGDDLYVTGRPDAQKKFAYVKEVYLSIIPEVEKGAPEAVKQEFEALLHMLELLFQNHSGYYTDEQLDWILDQVTYIHTAYPELRKKPIIKIED